MSFHTSRLFSSDQIRSICDGQSIVIGGIRNVELSRLKPVKNLLAWSDLSFSIFLCQILLWMSDILFNRRLIDFKFTHILQIFIQSSHPHLMAPAKVMNSLYVVALLWSVTFPLKGFCRDHICKLAEWKLWLLLPLLRFLKHFKSDQREMKQQSPLCCLHHIIQTEINYILSIKCSLFKTD